MDPIKVVIDNKEYVVDRKVFRRILVISQGVLSRLKREEKASFPAVDNAAANVICDMQFNHKDLI